MTSPIYTLRSYDQFWSDVNSVANGQVISAAGKIKNVSYSIAGNIIGFSVSPPNWIYLFPVTVTYNGKIYNYQAAYNFTTGAMSISDPETGLILNYNPAFITTQ